MDMEWDGDAKWPTNTTDHQAQWGPHTLVDCRPMCGYVIVTLLAVSICDPVGNLSMGGGELLVRVRA